MFALRLSQQLWDQLEFVPDLTENKAAPLRNLTGCRSHHDLCVRRLRSHPVVTGAGFGQCPPRAMQTTLRRTHCWRVPAWGSVQVIL